MELNSYITAFLAVLFLIVGYFIQSKFDLFKKWYVPAPFIGGILFSVINIFIGLKLDNNISSFFLVVFFAAVGLKINLEAVKKNIFYQLLFLAVVIVVAFSQNVFGSIIAGISNKTPLEGLILGSIGMMGDHSLVRLPIFNDVGIEFTQLLHGVSMFAIIIGGLAGGVFFKFIKNKVDLSKNTKILEPHFTTMDFLVYILLILLAVIIGYVPGIIGLGKFINPSGSSFLAGLLIRYIVDHFKLYEINYYNVNFLGNYSLSMLLILSFMTVDLIAITYLKPVHYIAILIQTGLLILFSYYVVFKLFKKNAFAAYLSSCIIGFSIGFAACTMATLQCITEEEGSVAPVHFVVPPVEGWMIDVINPMIIDMFFS